LSSAFEGLHPTVQKAVPRTTGKAKSKDQFKGRFLKDSKKAMQKKVHIRRNVKIEGTPKIEGRTLDILSMVL